MSENQEQHERANDYALALLIPEKVFKEKVASGMVRVGDLADHFKVPAMAVRHRARILGMNGHELRKGYRKIESL